MVVVVLLPQNMVSAGRYNMPTSERPLFPISFVRGYTGTENQIEDTVAEPYTSFNLGSTKYRQAWDGSVRRYCFEPLLLHLM
jgi:hypothetical protein